MEHHGNPQTAVFHEKLLDGICKLCHLARVLALACVTGASYLSQTISLFVCSLGLGGIKVAALVEQSIRPLSPETDHLRGLLLERHARQEVTNSLLGRQ